MSSLEQRYGARPPVKKRWWIVGVGSALAVFAGWAIWVNFGFSAIETRDISHSFDAATRTTTIAWSVTVKPGTPVSCAVQALNGEFQVVGWKVVDIPAGTEYSRQFSETIRTVMPPQAGLVYACWAS